MALQVHTTGSDEYGSYVKLLLCGNAGAGKTLLSSTFPNPLYVSAEGLLMSVASRGVRFIKVTSTQEIAELRGMLAQAPAVREKLLGGPVETLVIDTIDEVQKIFIEERKASKRQESLDQQGWGWVGEQVRGMVRGLRNLDMNVIFTCHLKESKDESSGQIFYGPALQGAMGGEMAQYVDLALLLRAVPTVTVKDGQSERGLNRILQTFPDSQHSWVKDHSGKLPPEFSVNFETDYERMRKLIFTGVNLGASKITEVGPKPEPKPEPAPETKPESEPTPSEAVSEAEEVLREDKVDQLAEAASARETPAPAASEEAEASTTSGDTPDTVSDPEATAQAPEPTAEASAGAFKCTECGAGFDSIDQKELGEIIYHRVLCDDCFVKIDKAAKAR